MSDVQDETLNRDKQEWIEIVCDKQGMISERGHWHWALWAADGELLACCQPQGYESEKACVAGARRAGAAMAKHPWIMRSSE